MTISVAIINHNSCEYLRACLGGLDPQACDEVIVVDNASSDGSVDMVRSDFPMARVIESRNNPGYGAAANIAMEVCSSEYVLLLNSDTLLQPGVLQALSDYLDQHPQAAVLGPALINPDGTAQESVFLFPTPFHILMRETRLPALINQLPGIGTDKGASRSPSSDQVVPWVLGAALAIRRPAFASVGGFDESFFMYFEEVDLCFRLQQAGWETHFSPLARIAHVGGASTRQNRAVMSLQLYRSLCHFYRKHYSSRERFLLRIVLSYLMLRNIVKDGLRISRTKKGPGNAQHSEDLRVWRSVLSGVWSPAGWLSVDNS